jgi:hypothetical protein
MSFQALVPALLAVLSVLAVLTSVPVVNAASVVDAPFFQDVSHRGLFKGQPAIADWVSMPFGSLKDQSPIAHVSANDCFVALSEGVLYSSSRNTEQVKLRLDSPYNAFKAIGELDSSSAGVMLLPSLDAKTSLYVLTSNNALAVSLPSGSCDSVSSVTPLLKLNHTWGTVAAATASSTHLWVASSTSPNTVTQINLAHGTTDVVKIAGMTFDDTISSLFWVESWNKLFVGSNAALFTLTVIDGKVTKTQHEWITGLLDSVVLDMAYDSVNDALWVAEVNSIHKLTTAGVWFRYGQRQGSTNAQINSVSAANGFVYVGSAVGLSRVRGDADPTQYYKGEQLDDRQQHDPWSWNYYAGHRYLPDDNVKRVFWVSTSAVWGVGVVVSAFGVTLLESALWTLDEKGVTMESFQSPRHIREGLTAGCNLDVYGDLTTYENRCEDSEGLWTSMHAMGEVFRYIYTTAEDSRQAAWTAFEALEKLSIYPGKYPYFPARSFATVANSQALMHGCYGEPWQASPVDPNYMWKATTSSDEIDGHLAIYPMIYDHIAQTDSEKKRAYDLIEGITGGILRDDLYLIDPSTGEPTKWGFWNPVLVNEDPEHYSERGTNSVEMLSFLASAYSVTHDAKYKDKFWELALDYDYLYSAINGKVDNPMEDNHSDNELFFQAYHILLYSLQRLSPDDAAVAGELYSLVIGVGYVTVLMPCRCSRRRSKDGQCFVAGSSSNVDYCARGVVSIVVGYIRRFGRPACLHRSCV